MARGFGTTYGSATTDLIATAYTGSSTTKSFWVAGLLHGLGGGSLGAIWRRTNEQLAVIDAANFTFRQLWSGATADWRFAIWATDVSGTIGVSYDGGNVANGPIVYRNGSKLTVGSGVTATTAPSGSNTPETSVFNIGNAAGGTRNWDGWLAEVAIWNVILTDSEFAALQAGYSPMLIRTTALVEYVPMLRDNVSRKLAAPTMTGTAVQPHPRIIMPRPLGQRRITAAPAFRAAWADGTNLPVLGTGTF